MENGDEKEKNRMPEYDYYTLHTVARLNLRPFFIRQYNLFYFFSTARPGGVCVSAARTATF